MARAADALLVAYFLHVLILWVAADVLANVTNTWGEWVDRPDLLDTVPISRGSRFRGETAGILATLVVIHLATLPLLVFVGILSPMGTPAIVALEGLVAVVMLFSSAAAAWKMRASRDAWARSRTLRALGVAGLLMLGVIFLTTRPAAFRDAAGAFLNEPAPRTWAAVAASVDNPLLLFVSLFACLGGALLFFYLQSTRPETRP
jgi:hypothetical protein